MTTEQVPLRDRVHDLATENGATFSASQFDGGIFYEISKPGTGKVRVSAEWGDDPDQIISILRTKMEAAGMLGESRHWFLLDFGGGMTTKVLATDRTHAIRMVGRGDPESITDIDTGETFEWVKP